MAGIGFAGAAHYKAVPGSFIGREIAYYAVEYTDESDPGYDADLFRLAVQAIQTQAEVLVIGDVAVDTGTSIASFTVIVAQTTANNGSVTDTAGNVVTNPNASTIESILQTVLDDGGAAFYQLTLSGTTLA